MVYLQSIKRPGLSERWSIYNQSRDQVSQPSAVISMLHLQEAQQTLSALLQP